VALLRGIASAKLNGVMTVVILLMGAVGGVINIFLLNMIQLCLFIQILNITGIELEVKQQMEVKLGGTQYCSMCGKPSPKGLILPEECPHCSGRSQSTPDPKMPSYSCPYCHARDKGEKHCWQCGRKLG